MNTSIKISLGALAVMVATITVTIIANQGFAWTNPTSNPPTGSPIMTVSGTNVGIGMTPGAYKLDVNGQVKGTGLCIGTDCKASWASASPIKAWVNFDGTTGAIRSGYNVASVVRESVGHWKINFTTPMTDANYAASWNTTPALGNENAVLVELNVAYVRVKLVIDDTADSGRDTSIGTIIVVGN